MKATYVNQQAKGRCNCSVPTPQPKHNQNTTSIHSVHAAPHHTRPAHPRAAAASPETHSAAWCQSRPGQPGRRATCGRQGEQQGERRCVVGGVCGWRMGCRGWDGELVRRRRYERRLGYGRKHTRCYSSKCHQPATAGSLHAPSMPCHAAALKTTLRFLQPHSLTHFGRLTYSSLAWQSLPASHAQPHSLRQQVLKGL